MTSETEKEKEDQHDFFNTGFLTGWVAQNAVHINREDSFASNKELFCKRTELFYKELFYTHRYSIRVILHKKKDLFYKERPILHTNKELFYTQRAINTTHKELFYTQRKGYSTPKSYSTDKELFYTQTKTYSTHKQRPILHRKTYSTHKNLFYTQTKRHSTHEQRASLHTKSYSTHKELLYTQTKELFYTQTIKEIKPTRFPLVKVLPKLHLHSRST